MLVKSFSVLKYLSIQIFSGNFLGVAVSLMWPRYNQVKSKNLHFEGFFLYHIPHVALGLRAFAIE